MKLQSLNADIFAPLSIDSMLQARGGSVTTGGGVFEHVDGRSIKFASDCADNIGGRTRFEAFDANGKYLVDWWG